MIRGAVAVIQREGRFLVIRRSRHVSAPLKYCFAGGRIERGESEAQAVEREIHEELSLQVIAEKKIWHSQTPWGVDLAWWEVSQPTREPEPNPREVASCHWMTPQQMLDLKEDLLLSARHFLEAVARGEIQLSSQA
ncbi:NUDIX hydrolase [Planctomycetales bacterium 10988]|nr:NUDIX hydrolase [Planctomycetales bacterium 10988]